MNHSQYLLSVHQLLLSAQYFSRILSTLTVSTTFASSNSTKHYPIYPQVSARPSPPKRCTLSLHHQPSPQPARTPMKPTSSSASNPSAAATTARPPLPLRLLPHRPRLQPQQVPAQISSLTHLLYHPHRTQPPRQPPPSPTEQAPFPLHERPTQLEPSCRLPSPISRIGRLPTTIPQ
jgi:hypothetical protein